MSPAEEHKQMISEQEPFLKGEKFKVPGAGFIHLSESVHSLTGGAVGFSFGVSWGRYGYTGGVLGRLEAIRLAEYILERCASLPESQHQERERRMKNL